MTGVACQGWRCAVLLTASIAMLCPASAEQGYRQYRNWRFGVSADVPSDWKAGPEPENNDGLVFTSPDGAATMTVSGILNAENAPAVEVIADEQRAQDGETVTYRKASARQAVISGTRGKMIFYRKAILSCNDQILHHLLIEYPVAQKQAFDALVSPCRGLHAKLAGSADTEMQLTPQGRGSHPLHLLWGGTRA